MYVVIAKPTTPFCLDRKKRKTHPAKIVRTPPLHRYPTPVCARIVYTRVVRIIVRRICCKGLRLSVEITPVYETRPAIARGRTESGTGRFRRAGRETGSYGITARTRSPRTSRAGFAERTVCIINVSLTAGTCIAPDLFRSLLQWRHSGRGKVGIFRQRALFRPFQCLDMDPNSDHQIG